jgi:hypothetical protein
MCFSYKLVLERFTTPELINQVGSSCSVLINTALDQFGDDPAVLFGCPRSGSVLGICESRSRSMETYQNQQIKPGYCIFVGTVMSFDLLLSLI